MPMFKKSYRGQLTGKMLSGPLAPETEAKSKALSG